MSSKERTSRRGRAALLLALVLVSSLSLAFLLLARYHLELEPSARPVPFDELGAVCWTLVAAGIAGTALASCGRRFGWLLLFGLQPLWIAYALCTGQHGLILGCVAYAGAQLNGFWRSGGAIDSPRPANPRSAHAGTPRVAQNST